MTRCNPGALPGSLGVRTEGLEDAVEDDIPYAGSPLEGRPKVATEDKGHSCSLSQRCSFLEGSEGR